MPTSSQSTQYSNYVQGAGYIQELSSLQHNPHAAEIKAVEQMEEELKQLQKCASQNPPDWQGIKAAFNQFFTEWSAFDKIHFDNPHILDDKAMVNMYNLSMQIAISNEDVGNLLQFCPIQLDHLADILKRLK